MGLLGRQKPAQHTFYTGGGRASRNTAAGLLLGTGVVPCAGRSVKILAPGCCWIADARDILGSLLFRLFVLHHRGAFHNENRVLERGNVLQRIAGDGNDVGKLSGANLPDPVRPSH